MQVTDDAIYAVFQGRTFKEIAEAAQKGDMTDGGSYIYVFSLMGELLRKYKLDRAVYGMFVDSQFRTLVVVDINKDEPIVKFCCNKEKYTLGK